MATKLINSNIPTITPTSFVNLVTAFVVNACANSAPNFRHLPTFMLWGQPGCGKSDAVQELTQKIADCTGKRTHCEDVRLLLFTQVDLKGVPVADQSRTFTQWLIPKIFNFDPSPDVINILMLDEISACPPSVQATAYQMTLDRKVGDKAFPDNVIVICAGNRTTDKSVAYKMPKALANRLSHFEFTVDVESWIQWAISNNVHEYVISFITNNHDKLDRNDDGDAGYAYASPRSWVKVSDMLKQIDGVCNAMGAISSTSTGNSQQNQADNVPQEWVKLASEYKSLAEKLHVLAGKFNATQDVELKQQIQKEATPYSEKKKQIGAFFQQKGTTAEEVLQKLQTTSVAAKPTNYSPQTNRVMNDFLKNKDDIIRKTVCSLIGEALGSEFYTSLRLFGQIPSYAEIASGNCKYQSTDSSVSYAIITRIITNMDPKKPKECQNALAYANTLGSDFAACLIKQICDNDSLFDIAFSSTEFSAIVDASARELGIINENGLGNGGQNEF